MSRRGFTLIELLAIVAIIGIMVAAGVASVRQGQSGVKLKSATRDIFATIRHARSMALVSREPSVVTYSTERDGDDVLAKIDIVTAKMFSGNEVESAETLDGHRRLSLETGEEVVEEKMAKGGDQAKGKGEGEENGGETGGGQTIEDILFEPVSTDVMRGIRLKVEMGAALAASTARTAVQEQSKISVFSTSGYILGKYQTQKEKAAKSEPAADKQSDTAAPGAASSADLEDQEKVSVVWEANGRVEPHKVWVYLDGKSHESGYCISIDRFGGAKVLSDDED